MGEEGVGNQSRHWHIYFKTRQLGNAALMLANVQFFFFFPCELFAAVLCQFTSSQGYVYLPNHRSVAIHFLWDVSIYWSVCLASHGPNGDRFMGVFVHEKTGMCLFSDPVLCQVTSPGPV